MISESSIPEIIHKQRNFFQTGKTKDINFRITQLKKLKQVILSNETAINQALKADLNKPELEAYITETAIVLKEIDYSLRHIKNWTKPKKTAVTLEYLPGTARIIAEPLGLVLIIGPWNYPMQLIIAPLVGAIAAGNCAIVKPSEYAPHTAQILAEILQKIFDDNYIAIVQGGVEISQKLLAEKFDHIFFTGGQAVGKIVMSAAAQNLTPVTLELGGKNPCIVDTDINIEYTARRITWGKFLNAGQTCVAPDYLLVNKNIKEDLLSCIGKTIHEFYGENPQTSPDYPRIINEKQFHRVVNLLKEGDIRIGGKTDLNELYIAPSIIENIPPESSIMESEIFGPILPVIEYSDITEAIKLINSKPKPLALYLFSYNQNLHQKVLEQTSSGGICINDTVLQFGVTSLPFGGVGDSGMGSYHGKASFDTFSHYRSILHRNFLVDVKLRYAPYKGKLAWLKRLLGQ